jgi:hypothetical protein
MKSIFCRIKRIFQIHLVANYSALSLTQDSICKLKTKNKKASAVNCNGKLLNRKLWQIVQPGVKRKKWQTFKSKTLANCSALS